jgi:hypothetical protein
MLRWVVAVIVVISVNCSASAQTREQQNIMEHASLLFVASDLCNNLIVDINMIALVAATNGVDPERAPFKNFLARRMQRDTETIRSSPSVACSLVYANYGPTGAKVKGIVTRR